MLKRKANENTHWQVKRECNKLDLGPTRIFILSDTTENRENLYFLVNKLCEDGTFSELYG